MKKNFLFGAIFLIIIVIFVVFFVQSTGSQTEEFFSASYDTPLGRVSINAKLPESPSNITMYRVIPSENDMVEYVADGWIDFRYNLTSETDAPRAAQKALIPYGGLPQDAKLGLVKTGYIEGYNSVTGEVTEKIPIETNVQYNRLIDGKPVVGDGGFIRMDLGDYGELLSLFKVWRTVVPDGTAPVIPVSAAIEKIKRGELFGHRPKCACQLNVDKISLGYFEKDRNEPQEFLEPVWIFSGKLSSGDSWNYYVYARESVDTTITTSSDSVQRKIPHADISANNSLKGISINNELTSTKANTRNIS